MKKPSSTKQLTSPGQTSPKKPLLRCCACCAFPTFPACVRFFTIANRGYFRYLLRLLQLGLSLAALVVQARLQYDTLSGGHIFFVFVTCFAFSFCLLLLFVYCTSVHNKVTEEQLMLFDFWIATAMGNLFLIASFMLMRAYDGKSDKTTAVVLGFVAGAAFLVDALILGCKFCIAARKRMEENKTKPLNPAGK